MLPKDSGSLAVAVSGMFGSDIADSSRIASQSCSHPRIYQQALVPLHVFLRLAPQHSVLADGPGQSTMYLSPRRPIEPSRITRKVSGRAFDACGRFKIA